MSDMNAEHQKRGWHAGREIPLAVIFAMAVQLGGVLMYGGALEERLKNVEVQVTEFVSQSRVDRDEMADQSERIAVLANKLANTNETIVQLRDEVRITNQLLRQLLTEGQGDRR